VLKLLGAFNNLLRTLLTLVIALLLGGGGWLAYRGYYSERLALEETQAQLADREAQIQEQATRITALNKNLEEKQREVERLQTIVKLLKLDHRIAHLTVLGQQKSPDGKEQTTTFSFVEVNDEGRPLEKPRVITIKGDVVYLDAWVVKFDLDYLEQGDPLRSTSICLFRGIFGRYQSPAEGYVIDAVGSQPTGYQTGGKPSEFEQEIWSRFWEYANDPALAKKVGIRAAHGEAPSIKLLPGKRYRVVLQASGGLSIDPPEDVSVAEVPKT